MSESQSRICPTWPSLSVQLGPPFQAKTSAGSGTRTVSVERFHLRGLGRPVDYAGAGRRCAGWRRCVHFALQAHGHTLQQSCGGGPSRDAGNGKEVLALNESSEWMLARSRGSSPQAATSRSATASLQRLTAFWLA
eukprot:1290397-Rhodomonas_salina.1